MNHTKVWGFRKLIRMLRLNCKNAFGINTPNVWASYNALTPLPYRLGVICEESNAYETVAPQLRSAFKLSSKVNVAEHIFKLIASPPTLESVGIRSYEAL